MIENTKAGLDAARARGKHGGRPKKLDSKKTAMARELRNDKTRTVKEICEVLKISRATFYNYTGERDI
jgi:DNA invertase Pin-like site-specific DNA recombinase